MKKVIFSIALFTGSFLSFDATAQVSVSVRIGVPIYCPPPPPARVVIVSPPPARIVVVKPPLVVIAPVRPVVVIKPVSPPRCIAGRHRRPVVVYR